MIDGQDYKRLLHSHRMKSTKPRNAVLSVLGEKDCALTAEEIYRALVQKGDGVNSRQYIGFSSCLLKRDW